MDENLHITVTELLDAIELHMNNALASLATQSTERAKLGVVSAGIARWAAELALAHVDELHSHDIQKFRAARSRASDVLRSYWEDFHLTLNVQPEVKPTISNVTNERPAAPVEPRPPKSAPSLTHEARINPSRIYHPRHDKDQKQEVIAMLRLGPQDQPVGEWLNEIADTYGMGYSTVSGWYYDEVRKQR